MTATKGAKETQRERKMNVKQNKNLYDILAVQSLDSMLSA
jgi:hypothetical protein